MLTDSAINFVILLVVASHLALFIDSSRFQKFPISRLNHVTTSLITSLSVIFIMEILPKVNELYTLVTEGVLTILILTPLTLNIQRLIKW